MRNAMIWCLVACAACGSKKDDKAAGSGAPPGPATAGSGAGVAAGGSGAGAMGTFQNEAGTFVKSGLVPERKTRIFECAFVRAEGEGKERKVVFKLKNLGDRKADGAQSWIYYYDSAGKLLGRYPHRFFTSLEADGTEEQALGHKGASIPKDAAVFDCEISEVAWKDKTKWFNENLSSYAIERPRGGFSHEQLIEREGERVTATWTGKIDERPVIALKNTSARPLTAKVVWIYQYDGAGKQLDRGVSNVSIDLEPGAQVEEKIGPKELKPGAKYLEPVVSEVRFRDGQKEQWLNDNLAPIGGRPMQGVIAPVSAPAPAAAPGAAPAPAPAPAKP